MKKKIGVGIVTAFMIASVMTGCGNDDSTVSNETIPEIAAEVTEAPTEPTTKVTTTEAPKTIFDVEAELKKEYNDRSTWQIDAQSDDSINIYYYCEGMKIVLDRCRTDGDFSMDAYEIWSDQKKLFKKTSKSLANEYPEFPINIYVLNDDKSSLPVDGEYSYIAHFSNGYCLYDYSD